MAAVLRRLCTAGVPLSPRDRRDGLSMTLGAAGSGASTGRGMGSEREDREVLELARQGVDLLDRGVVDIDAVGVADSDMY